MQELFGAKMRSWKRDVDGNKRISLRELNRFNEAILPLVGIGEDCFYLNEWLGKNGIILDFPTLRDYDEDDYGYQENARKRDDPCYTSKPYRGNLYLGWARLFVDGKFTYATLSMAAGYLFSHLEEAATALIETRIPHGMSLERTTGRPQGIVFNGTCGWRPTVGRACLRNCSIEYLSTPMRATTLC